MIATFYVNSSKREQEDYRNLHKIENVIKSTKDRLVKGWREQGIYVGFQKEGDDCKIISLMEIW